MNWLKILSGIPQAAADYFKRRMEIKHEDRQQERELKRATVERQIELRRQGMADDAAWELESLKIHSTGWKDEFILILLSIPLILVFFPPTAPYVLTGFQILESTPQWYRWLILMIFTAVYGIRVWRRHQSDT
jgi:hypothetical protein